MIRSVRARRTQRAAIQPRNAQLWMASLCPLCAITEALIVRNFYVE